jgi:hypothetical protein
MHWNSVWGNVKLLQMYVGRMGIKRKLKSMDSE